MVGFQICSQNSNRITFDPLSGKKKLENWVTQYLVNFRVFFGQKGDQMSCDLNVEVRFGILPSFYTLYASNCNYFHICMFWPTMTFSKFCKSHVRSFFKIDFFFKVGFGISPPKDIIMAGMEIGLLKKWWSQPGLMTYWGFLGEGQDVSFPTEKSSSRAPVLGISTIILKKAFRRGKMSLLSGK